MKLPLESYSTDSPDLKVFSYVVEVPFATLDIDVRRLVRELGWNKKVDRFRVWNIPKIRGKTERNCPYVMLKKLDSQRDVLLVARIDFNPYDEEATSWMAISMLCNDDEYPDRLLSLIANQPPAFHSLEEFRVMQKAWVNDEEAVSFFKDLLVKPSVAKEALSRMSEKEERRNLEFIAKRCYYPLSGENIEEKPVVTVQVATETPYYHLTLNFNVERSKVANEITKMLKDLDKAKLPKNWQARVI